MSTLAIVKRETDSWRWPIAMLVYMNGLAYVAALVVYRQQHGAYPDTLASTGMPADADHGLRQRAQHMAGAAEVLALDARLHVDAGDRVEGPPLAWCAGSGPSIWGSCSTA